MKYRKKPVVIDAVQWTGLNSVDICSFAGPGIESIRPNEPFKIATSEGDMVANIGDYIIKEPFDKERGFYPCKPDIFKATYEEVK